MHSSTKLWTLTDLLLLLLLLVVLLDVFLSGSLIELALPVIVIGGRWHCRLHLLLVDLHVVDVEGEVVRSLCDLDVDEDLSVDGEIIRYEEGNEIELIPGIQ